MPTSERRRPLRNQAWSMSAPSATSSITSEYIRPSVAYRTKYGSPTVSSSTTIGAAVRSIARRAKIASTPAATNAQRIDSDRTATSLSPNRRIHRCSVT
jgi:hypothetical protein